MASNRFGIFGLNYDTEAGLGWPGARYAPDQIRESLKWILNRIRDNVLFDTENNALIDMSKIEIKDFGNLRGICHYEHKRAMEEAKLQIDEVFDAGYTPILLGGDHSVAWPGMKSLYDHTEGKMGLIHLDTHLDLVEDSPVQGKYSGSSEIRRCAELERVDTKNIVQLGIRGYNYAEHYHFINDNGIHVINPDSFFEDGAKAVAERALEIAGDGTDKIYMTVDVDVLDSAFAPGTGANEPGGISTYQLFKFVKTVAPYVNAVDIVEVNPMTDYRNMTSTVASNLIMHFISSNYYALEGSLQ